MTAIDMPVSPGFTDCSFYLVTNTQTFVSPMTKTTQSLELSGAIWSATYSLPAMTRQQAAPWIAFLMRLKGQVNTFNAYDPDCVTPLGGATGTPLVKGGGQTGNTLTTDGWTASITTLKASDYFTVNGELKRMTADAVSDGSSNCTLTFEPPLRSSPPDNTPIIVTKAPCAMILTDDMQAKFQVNNMGIYQPKTFTAIEKIS